MSVYKNGRFAKWPKWISSDISEYLDNPKIVSTVLPTIWIYRFKLHTVLLLIFHHLNLGKHQYVMAFGRCARPIYSASCRKNLLFVSRKELLTFVTHYVQWILSIIYSLLFWWSGRIYFIDCHAEWTWVEIWEIFYGAVKFG